MRRSRLTCRYWALGPRCPNGKRCTYAHRDTGQLVSHLYQRGTCAWWARGECHNAKSCFYEHRQTGVPGLYQGVIELSGTDLEVANVARAAGFNTFNHAALYDLIWAVKRVTRQQVHYHLNPPPADPIYPDRYRPSGVSNNTERKRKPLDDDIPPFHPVLPLINRKRKQDPKENNTTAARCLVPSGTQANPVLIDLSSDDERPNFTSVLTKRQKLASNEFGVHAITSQSPVATGKLNAAVSIMQQLSHVQIKLQEGEKIMSDCRLIMKSLFDEHDDKLGCDDILPLLVELGNKIFRAQDGATEGVTQMSRVIQWAQCPENDSVIEPSR